MLEDLIVALEPYASYRFTLGLVLAGLTLYVSVSGLISLRQFMLFLADVDRQSKGARLLDAARLALDPACDLSRSPRLSARPGRIVRNAVLISFLRLISWRTLMKHWPEFLVLALLTALCLAAYGRVFALA